MTVAASSQSGTVFSDAIWITAPTSLAGEHPDARSELHRLQSPAKSPIEEPLIAAVDSTPTASSTGSPRDAC